MAPSLEWRRAHSWRREILTSSPPRVKHEEFSEKVSPHASYFSHVILHSSFSEKATKGCHTFLHGEEILFTPLFPHSPFSDLGEGVTTPNGQRQENELKLWMENG